MAEGVQETKPHGFYQMPLELFLPRMRRSFMDRQYSPSTGMDRSEWEITLEELTRMGLIVKREPVSDGDD
jgi:hypothetical protein